MIYFCLIWTAPDTFSPGLPWRLPDSSDGKESSCNAGDRGSIPGSGRSPGGGPGSPLQCFRLESPHGQMSLAGCSHGLAESDTTAAAVCVLRVRRFTLLISVLLGPQTLEMVPLLPAVNSPRCGNELVHLYLLSVEMRLWVAIERGAGERELA